MQHGPTETCLDATIMFEIVYITCQMIHHVWNCLWNRCFKLIKFSLKSYSDSDILICCGWTKGVLFVCLILYMFILYTAGQYIFVDFIMKDDDWFFKTTKQEMNQQVISFAIPNGHVDSPIGFVSHPKSALESFGYWRVPGLHFVHWEQPWRIKTRWP